MSNHLENLYPDQYKKIKNLGYDTIEIRDLQANLDLDYHLHPFKACMYIISGEVKIKDLNKKAQVVIKFEKNHKISSINFN